MTERKTCGTCGRNGRPCGWWPHNCSRRDDESLSGLRSKAPECDRHATYRQQRERAETAEARLAELEAALEEAAQRVKKAEARVAELEPWADKGVEYAEYLHSDTCRTVDELKTRIAELEDVMQKAIAPCLDCQTRGECGGCAVVRAISAALGGEG